MGDAGTHTDFDMDMYYDSDLDPHTEAYNMLMKDMAALVVYRSIETRRATIDFDSFHKHIDRHSNFTNGCSHVHLQAL